MTIVNGKSVAFNSALNIGTGMVVALLNLLFVPLLISSFGVELFGVLSITWMILANLAWLDLGFSRATARFVSMELNAGNTADGARWTWVALATQACVGAIASVLLFSFAGPLVNLLDVDPQKQILVIFALHLFAFAIPLDLSSRAMSGVLEAGQRFAWINALNLAQTFLTFGVYAIGILNGGNFKAVITGLFVVRIIVLASTFACARRVLPELGSLPKYSDFANHFSVTATRMLQFGWWVSVASFCGSLLLYFDRWVIGAIIGVALLPYFTVPMSLLSRLSILPGSIVSTLFPALSVLHARGDWHKINDYFLRSQRYILIISTPMLFILYVWAPLILHMWISGAFAERASGAMRVLVIGFAIGLFAPIVGSMLEARGRPDFLAKLYLIELPFNVLIVILFTKYGGLWGAAVSFTARTIAETVALWFILYSTETAMSGRLLTSELMRASPMIMGMTMVALVIDGRVLSGAATVISITAVLTCFAYSWFIIMDSADRAHVLGILYSRGKE